MSRSKPILPTEHEEQVLVIQWANAKGVREPVYKRLMAVPNGGQRNKVVAAKLKAEGVRRGVPDLFLPAPVEPYGGLWIEMKRKRGGRLSKEQHQWFEYLRNAGYAVAMCQGATSAIDVIQKYLRGNFEEGNKSNDE